VDASAWHILPFQLGGGVEAVQLLQYSQRQLRDLYTVAERAKENK
jgi:hypothetical protein